MKKYTKRTSDPTPPSKKPHHAPHQAGKAPTVGDERLRPTRKGIDTTTAMITSATVTMAASMIYAISLRTQWFWTVLSSLSNSKPVGDWTPMVPRTEAPHLGQKPASSRSSLPHFQQKTNGYSHLRALCRNLKLNGR